MIYDNTFRSVVVSQQDILKILIYWFTLSGTILISSESRKP